MISNNVQILTKIAYNNKAPSSEDVRKTILALCNEPTENNKVLARNIASKIYRAPWYTPELEHGSGN